LKDTQINITPGGFTDTPTVVAANLAEIVPLLSEDDSEYCASRL